MPFWLPQQIQRKLFLYALQHISILSNLDLSNIDISLAKNGTNLTFNNVDLMLDNIVIPGIELKKGTIESLEIKLSVSGEIIIKGINIEFLINTKNLSVLTDNPDNNNYGNKTKSTDFFEDNTPLSDSNIFSLAKSIQDITNSMLQLPDPLLMDVEDELVYNTSLYTSISSSNSSQSSEYECSSDISLNENTVGSNMNNDQRNKNKNVNRSNDNSTAFQKMKKRILNNMLSKLSICLENINFHFVLPVLTIPNIDCQLNKILLKPEVNGFRSILMEHLKFFYFSYDILNSLDQEDSSSNTANSGREVCGSDSEDDLAMTESIYLSQNQEISMYMSALENFNNDNLSNSDNNQKSNLKGNSNDNTKTCFPSKKEEHILFELQSIEAKLSGLSSIDDLSLNSVDIHITDPTISFENILKLNKMFFKYIISFYWYYLTVKSDIDVKLENHSNDNVNSKINAENKPVNVKDLPNYKRFEKEQNLFQDCNLTININNIRALVDKNLNIQFRDTSIYRNLETGFDIKFTVNDIIIVGEGIRLLPFAGNNPLVTAIKNETDIKIKCNSEFSLELTPIGLKNIIVVSNLFLDKFSQTIGIIDEMRAFSKNTLNSPSRYNSPINEQDKNGLTLNNDTEISLETKNLEIILKLKSYELAFSLSPFNYSSNSNIVLIDKISIDRYKPNHFLTNILTINEISTELSSLPTSINSYDENNNSILIFTKIVTSIKHIIFYETFENLTEIIEDFSDILTLLEDQQQDIISKKSTKLSVISGTKLKKATTDDNQYLKKSVRILNNSDISYKQRVYSLFFLKIELVEIKLSNLPFNDFGALKFEINNMEITCSDNNKFSILFYDISSIRIPHKLNNKLLTSNNQEFIISNSHLNDGLPCLYISNRSNNKIRIVVRNFTINYYTSWLPFFQSTQNEDIQSKSNRNTSKQTLIPWEMKFIDCCMILHPLRLHTALALILDYLIINGSLSSLKVKCLLKSGTILLTDNASTSSKPPSNKQSNRMLYHYISQGYTTVGRVETINIYLTVSELPIPIDINIWYTAFSLCADSYNALLQTIIDLKIPLIFTEDLKYKTQLPKAIDTFKDIDTQYFNIPQCSEIKKYSEDIDEYFHIDEELFFKRHQPHILNTFSIEDGEIEIDENYLTTKNSPLLPTDNNSRHKGTISENAIFALDINIKKIAIKFFDGYDWKFTRKKINNTINDVGINNISLQSDDESAKGYNETNVFDSVFITVNKSDSTRLKKIVTDEIHGDEGGEMNGTKANLRPSKNHKILIKLTEVCINYEGFPFILKQTSLAPAQVSNLSIAVEKFEVIDNVSTSTWNKLITPSRLKQATVLKNMIELKMETFRPKDYLAAIEGILEMKVSPLRLHIDQTTLEFLLRFIQFNDSRFSLVDDYQESLYLQKFSFQTLNLAVDYKPRKVSYSGLRSGYSSELLNFFGLDNAKIKLLGLVLRGIDDASALGEILQAVWIPDIISRQIPTLISGLSIVNPIAALGKDMKSIVKTPIKEYKESGQLVRGVRKSGNIFVKTAAGDFVRLGIKLAAGTQALLEEAECLFGGIGSAGRNYHWDENNLAVKTILEEDQLLGRSNPTIHNRKPTALIIEESTKENEPPKLVSLYANQPLDIHKGLEEAYSSLEKNLHIAYDALWKDFDNEETEPNTISAAAVSLTKAAPVAIIRPLIGTTEALSKALQGVSNQLDKERLLENRDKYKDLALNKN
ncbi:hypothetical protein TBLA_0B00100 [Henningerozyma blattae CBS 6284]|uniref:Autophagy-related protein 2 n=1 Tax=Henningerozyma blattae (strain ATCC 34711 / CBS 6284 / DSM 70876 / NBRC 10599 / NRRL Y-10934 / UCD 77-7) TaxID=1071380 RepID=I2GXK3_HENB6|nr:hypothetical protein TBLA_0B00100 [Tetrapisispora blattae CBS 6284]CCH58855.1 hypothetical protein TBLA_0B00100 [Tetrapisispora blattae CBS 6284]